MGELPTVFYWRNKKVDVLNFKKLKNEL